MEEIAATVGNRHRRRVSIGISIIISFCIIENSSLLYPAIPATRSTSYSNHRHGIYSSLKFVSMMSQDDDNDSSSSSLGVSTTVVISPSERSQRKAAQRDRNKVRSTQTQINSNKATSQHPDAILKRNRQKKDLQQQQQQQNRRKHNYAERAIFLQQNDTILNDGEITDDSTTTSSVETTVGVRPLHSMAVTKLDKMSTTEDVVKAIKRAQNYHDMHDIREIATFLLEEVGEYTNFLHMRTHNVHISTPQHVYTKCKH
jgi:hypothetical protein